MFHMHPLCFDDAKAFLKFLQDCRKAEMTFCRKANGDVNIAQPQTGKYFSLCFSGKVPMVHTNQLSEIPQKYSLDQ